MLKYLAGPLIGALIGYFTNYIAVKMLFYPRKEVRIGGHKLPFTPGVIPRGKSRLAKAVGEAVGNVLLTEEDIKKKFESDEVNDAIVNFVSGIVNQNVENVLKNELKLPEQKLEAGREKIETTISNIMVEALKQFDYSNLLVEKGIPIIKQKLNNPMLMMFINDELLVSILAPMGAEMTNMIGEKGNETILPMVHQRFEKMGGSTMKELLAEAEVSEEMIADITKKAIQGFIDKAINGFLKTFNVKETVETKINDMSVEELEKLVLSVMKKELNTIVNLGALIGFIMGLLNIVF